MNDYPDKTVERARSLRWALAVVAVLLLCGVGRASAQGTSNAVTLVDFGSSWKYLATGEELSGEWHELEYDDRLWPEGPAELGYGDGDESTLLPLGSDHLSRPVTTYFRRSFVVTNLFFIEQVLVELIRDDGGIVYLNGTEIFRSNLPGGTVDPTTLATTNVFGAGETDIHELTWDADSLLRQTNVLAVEIHQASAGNVDLSFDLRLSGVNRTQRVRGPYLQLGTPTGMTIRWRTSVPNDSKVCYGTNSTRLDQVYYDVSEVTEHIVALTGLKPATRYYYSVGSSVAQGGGSGRHFTTAPLGLKPTRIWAIGDSGTGSDHQRDVRDAYYADADGRSTDVWLMLGDNAYGSGTDAQYQRAVFDIYSEILQTTCLWPTIGNHDYYSATAPYEFSYLDIFSLPSGGEAGGVPSGTEKYYSFNYGNIHFVCLDSMSSDRSAAGLMCTWLSADLDANTNDWIIAYWHHPPYSAGSHNSDFEGELVQMRQGAVPILEAYDADLVLSGHSHSYERSYLLSGHYGVSGTIRPWMLKDPGDGREDGTGPYIKPDLNPGTSQGTVYTVAGCSGQGRGGGSLDHLAMCVSINGFGSVVLDVDGLRLDARFLTQTGEIQDYFTILKGEVNRPLKFTGVSKNSGMLKLTWQSIPETWYLVQRTADLESGEWVTVAGPIEATGSTSSCLEPNQDEGAAAFYRIVVADP